MNTQTQHIKGMPDILPSDTGIWQWVERTIQAQLSRYGYQEIRLPLVEYSHLFQRSIGQATDIVEKEMYSFADRHDESISLRPEGTAGCVRAMIQHGLLDNQQQHRLWYQGPMFRYENPQKGRQRQFHQLGVECFGMGSVHMDAELIQLTHTMLMTLQLDHVTQLQINTLGSSEARATYQQALIEYLKQQQSRLDADSQRRLSTNPLRILDSKSSQTQQLLNEGPCLIDYIDSDSRQRFEQLQSLLTFMKVPFTINHRLVRGLDYYNDTVFEWVTDALGAQGTVCAGGRYDMLAHQLGYKQPAPAIGFAAGLERLCLLSQVVSSYQQQAILDVYVVVVGDEPVYRAALNVAATIRQAMPSIRMIVHTSGGSFKSQMKKADKSTANIALLMGEDECQQQTVTLKPLRNQALQQETIAQDQIVLALQSMIF